MSDLRDRLAAALDKAGVGYDLENAGRILDELHAAGLTIAVRPHFEPGEFSLHDSDRQPILVDALGAAAARMQPTDELAVILDVEGNRNRPPSAGDYAGEAERVEERYLLAPGQAAELIVDVILAVRRGGLEAMHELDNALVAMKDREP